MIVPQEVCDASGGNARVTQKRVSVSDQV
jgi:hypothetical protein